MATKTEIKNTKKRNKLLAENAMKGDTIWQGTIESLLRVTDKTFVIDQIILAIRDGKRFDDRACQALRSSTIAYKDELALALRAEVKFLQKPQAAFVNGLANSLVKPQPTVASAPAKDALLDDVIRQGLETHDLAGVAQALMEAYLVDDDVREMLYDFAEHNHDDAIELARLLRSIPTSRKGKQDFVQYVARRLCMVDVEKARNLARDDDFIQVVQLGVPADIAEKIGNATYLNANLQDALKEWVSKNPEPAKFMIHIVNKNVEALYEKARDEDLAYNEKFRKRAGFLKGLCWTLEQLIKK